METFTWLAQASDEKSPSFGPNNSFFLECIPALKLASSVYCYDIFFNVTTLTSPMLQLNINLVHSKGNNPDKVQTFDMVCIFQGDLKRVQICKLVSYRPFQLVVSYRDLSKSIILDQIDCEATIRSDLKRFQTKEDSKDVTFKIESHLIKAHKMVLEMRSPTFQKMFNVDMKEHSTLEVAIEDISYECFRAFLEFIYSDDCSQLETLAEELLYAAEKYEVDGLKMKCAYQLLAKIDVSNALHVLVLLDRYHLEEHKKAAVNYIVKNRIQVFKANSSSAFEKEHSKLAAEVYKAGFFEYAVSYEDQA